ncbi:MAG: mechanosensitive ion channel [Caulobacter sp.]|nr:mechanosensitive ion channel [Caulobacter sp.]
MASPQEQILAWMSDPVISRIALFVVLAIALITAIRIIQGVAVRAVSDSGSRYRIRKLVGFGGYVGAALILAAVLGQQFAQLTVIVGVAGAGIAFALQEVISSAAGWIAILFGRFYKVGDRVKLGGIKGDVIDIGVLRTTLMELGDWVSGDNYNGRIVRVANSFVFKEPVFNYSGDFPFLWDEIAVPIRFGSDWKAAKAIVLEVVTEEVKDFTDASREQWKEVVSKYFIENARIDPFVTLKFDDNWITLTARYLVPYKFRRGTVDNISETLLERFSETPSIQLASATFEVTAMPEVALRMADKPGA